MTGAGPRRMWRGWERRNIRTRGGMIAYLVVRDAGLILALTLGLTWLITAPPGTKTLCVLGGITLAVLWTWLDVVVELHGYDYDHDKQKTYERVAQGLTITPGWQVSSIPIPGDNRQFPIEGPPVFQAAVRRLLDDLRSKSPQRYAEALQHLPTARYDPVPLRVEHGGAAANSDGVFALDGSDYDQFRFAFLHEVGHNIRRTPGVSASEDEANDYAATVIAELR